MKKERIEVVGNLISVDGDYIEEMNVFGTRTILIKNNQVPFYIDFYIPRLYPREVHPNERFVFVHRDIEIKKVIRSNKYLAICGNPGYGKTHELKHLFNLLRSNPKNLVHFEKLSDYKTYRFDVKIETKDSFEKRYLLLDGIDESNMVYVHADIEKFIRNNPEWSIIVTSRTAVFVEENFQPFKKYNMESLSESGIQLFIENSISNYDEFKNKLKELDLWSKSHIPFYLNLFLEQKDYILSDESDSRNLLDQIFEKTIERRLQPSLLNVSNKLTPKIEESVKTISFINILRNEYKITISNLKSILGEDEELTEFVVASSSIVSNISDELQLFDQKIQEYLAVMVLQRFDIKYIKKIVLTQGVTKTLKYQWIAPLKHLLLRSSDKGILNLLLKFMPHAFISTTDLELNDVEIKKVIQYLKFEFIYYPNKIYHHTFFELKSLKVFLQKYRKYDFLIELLKSTDQDTLAVTCKVLSFFNDFNDSQKNKIDDICNQLLARTDIQISTRSNVLELHSTIIDYFDRLDTLYVKEFNQKVQVPYVLQIISDQEKELVFIADILSQYSIDLQKSGFDDNNMSFHFVGFFQNIKDPGTVLRVLSYLVENNISSNHQDFLTTWFKRLKEYGDVDYLVPFAYQLLNGNYYMLSSELKHLVEVIISEDIDLFVENHKEANENTISSYRSCLAQIIEDSNLDQLIALYKSSNIIKEFELTYKHELKHTHPNENKLAEKLIEESVIEEPANQVDQAQSYEDSLWILAESYDGFRAEFVKEFSNPIIKYDERLKACYSKWSGNDCHLIQFAFPKKRILEYTQIDIEDYHKKHWSCCMNFEALAHVFRFLSPEKITQVASVSKDIIESTIAERSKKTTGKFYRSGNIDVRLYNFVVQGEIIFVPFELAKHFLKCVSLYSSNQNMTPLEYIDKLGAEDDKIQEHLIHLLAFENIEEHVIVQFFEYFVYKRWSTEVFVAYVKIFPKLLKKFVNEHADNTSYIASLLHESNDKYQIDLLSHLPISLLSHHKDIIISCFENQSEENLKLRAAIIAIKIQYLPSLKYYLEAIKNVENYRHETIKYWVDSSGFSILINYYLNVDFKSNSLDYNLIRIKGDLQDCILRVVGENYSEYWKFVGRIKFYLLKYEGIGVVTKLTNIRNYMECRSDQGPTLIRLLDDMRFRYSISGKQLTLEEAMEIYRNRF